MESHALSQSQSQSARQSRKRQARARPSDAAGNTQQAPVASQAQAWGAAAVRAHDQPQVQVQVPQQVAQPGFPSQQLDSHTAHQQQVADSDLLNGYGAAPQQHQYADPSAPLGAPSQNDPTGLTLSIAGDQQHPHAHQHHQQQGQPPPGQSSQQQQQVQQAQQAQQQAQQQQRPAAASANKTDRLLFQAQYGQSHSGNDSAPAAVANPAPATPYNVQNAWAPAAGSAPPANMAPQSPAPRLAPPPEGIFRTFDDLLASIQKVAKDQGYGVVKLRASNYRDGKPTRYDLVCDRGGVKYNSTAKKRNPSTRKVDCPWRAKAVCEVNLGNQWRFAVQESRHNHEPRVPAAVPGQENTPIAQSIRSLGNKIDRLQHDLTQSLNQVLANLTNLSSRVEGIEKRFDAMEAGMAGRSLLGGNGMSGMGNPNIPTANMGAGGMSNGTLTNGGMSTGPMMDNRMSSIERVNVMERANGLESMQMMDDDPNRMGMMVPS